MEKQEVLRIFEDLKSSLQLDFALKTEQLDIVTQLINGKDVFGVLPTGFGKSVCYILPPLILFKTSGQQKTALVISPLKALILQQVAKLRDNGIKACAICDGGLDDTSIKAILSGQVDVLFASPESILQASWLKVIRKTYGKQIILQACDEAHCISEWGLEFRPAYRAITQLCSTVEAPTLALTATATRRIQSDIYEVLCLDEENTKTVCQLPNRPSIFIHFLKTKENSSEELKWLEEWIRERGVQTPKTTVFYGSIHRCQTDYNHIISNLGGKCYHHNNVARSERMIEMFHSATSTSTKNRILEEFCTAGSKIRVLLATLAFGMGVDIPDIRVIINWGLPRSVLEFWQESGRCGRDGGQGVTVCYAFQRSITKCEDKTLKDMCRMETCLRKQMMETFLLTGMSGGTDTLGQGKYACNGDCAEVCTCRLCSCCTFCFNLCKCANKRVEIFKFL